jgi:hypothetical protein
MEKVGRGTHLLIVRHGFAVISNELLCSLWRCETHTEHLGCLLLAIEIDGAPHDTLLVAAVFLKVCFRHDCTQTAQPKGVSDKDDTLGVSAAHSIFPCVLIF